MIILKILRGFYIKIFSKGKLLEGRNWSFNSNKLYSNNLIYNILNSDNPCMIGRFGSNELNCVHNYLAIKNGDRNIISFIKGNTMQWWWNKNMLKLMQRNAGFFPATPENAERFSELILQDMQELDVLGSWLNQEKAFTRTLKNVKRVVLEDLEPFFSDNPWTKALEGKKVLVVHPFSETIESQYKKRELLFENNLLPAFELITIKAVQSIGGENTEYKDWFEAFDGMKKQIEATDFDICILGCGAYGFPLAAHVKRMGKKAVHLGGVTQILFGVIGSRWENFVFWPYMNLFNEHWVRPEDIEKPINANQVEGACYW
tara:strand:- start:2908 stop:3858 length:951 start_codon:yes stop_codon:yes gene_type:complete